LYDPEGKPVYVAHVGTGFTQQLLDSLMVEFKKLKGTSAPFIPRDIEGVTWVEPRLVCEVIYQVVTRDCRLRMLRLHRLRIDKEPSECTIDQIEGQGKCFVAKDLP
jgi:bifunctional non-homologous end joining protein LigD